MGTQTKGRVGKIPQGGTTAGSWLSGRGYPPLIQKPHWAAVTQTLAGTTGCAGCSRFLGFELSTGLMEREPRCLCLGMLRLKF